MTHGARGVEGEAVDNLDNEHGVPGREEDLGEEPQSRKEARMQQPLHYIDHNAVKVARFLTAFLCALCVLLRFSVHALQHEVIRSDIQDNLNQLSEGRRRNQTLVAGSIRRACRHFTAAKITLLYFESSAILSVNAIPRSTIN